MSALWGLDLLYVSGLPWRPSWFSSECNKAPWDAFASDISDAQINVDWLTDSLTDLNAERSGIWTVYSLVSILYVRLFDEH